MSTPPSDEQLRRYAEQYADRGDPIQMFARAVLRLLDERDRMLAVVEAAKRLPVHAWGDLACVERDVLFPSTRQLRSTEGRQMTIDEMKRIARVAADGYPEDQEMFYATFSPKTVKKLLAVVEAANDPHLKVMAPHTMEQIGLTKALAALSTD